MGNKQPTQEQIKEFCLRVNAWSESGVPISLGDLKELAIELGTPIPHFDENLNLVFDETSSILGNMGGKS